MAEVGFLFVDDDEVDGFSEKESHQQDCDTTEGYFSDTSFETDEGNAGYNDQTVEIVDSVTPVSSAEKMAELIAEEEFDEAAEFLSNNIELLNRSHKDKPLFLLAAEKKSFNLIMKFITLGVDQTLCDNDGNTILHLVTWDPTLIMCIINMKKIDINVTNNCGETCLFVAVRERHTLTCKILLSHKINHLICNDDGETAFDFNDDEQLDSLMQRREEMNKVLSLNTKAVERALLTSDINEKKQELLSLKPCAEIAEELRDTISSTAEDIERKTRSIAIKEQQVKRLKNEIVSEKLVIAQKERLLGETRIKFEHFEGFLQKYENLDKEIEELRAVEQVEKQTNPICNFECPICYDIFQKGKKIFQCTQGHHFCESCNSKITSCPTCRESLRGTSIRNRVLESLVQSML